MKLAGLADTLQTVKPPHAGDGRSYAEWRITSGQGFSDTWPSARGYGSSATWTAKTRDGSGASATPGKSRSSLIKDASVKLGLDPKGIRGTEPVAEQRRKTLGALGQFVTGITELTELCNADFGTGHGVSQRPGLDVATALLAVAAARRRRNRRNSAFGAAQVTRGAPAPHTTPAPL